GGNVPFKIFTADSAEPLIVGHCEGTYTAESESFTGSGDIRLGRNVEFDLGGGTRIDFLAGSGGNATVTENELTQLGGTLMADLYMDGEQFLHIEGEGEYNAVTNELVRLSGSASLTREWSLLDGNIVITNIEGHATIENGQLVEAGGEAGVRCPNLGN